MMNSLNFVPTFIVEFSYILPSKYCQCRRLKLKQIIMLFLIPFILWIGLFSNKSYCLYRFVYIHSSISFCMGYIMVINYYCTDCIMVEYVYKFHRNLWRLGYDQKIQCLSNTHCLRVLKEFDNFYKDYHQSVLIKNLLTSLFSLDISNIIHQYTID